MGYTSQSGNIAFRTQTGRGITATDMATAGIAVRRRSGSLAGNRELLVPDAEIGGGRDVPDAGLGTSGYSGDIEMYLRFNSILTFLNAALGTTATAVGTSGEQVHTITPSDGAALPFLSVYEEVSSALDTAMYTDAVVNTFHLEVEPNGFLSCTVGLIAVKQLLGVPVLDVSGRYDETAITVGTNTLVKYDGTNAKAKSFSLDINNNFEDDDYRLGQFTIEDLTPKRREVTASMGMRHESKDMMRQALNGSAASVSPTGITTKKPVVFEVTSYENIPGSTPAVPYGLTLTMPQVIFEPFAFEPSGDDVLENDIAMRALRPSLATPIITAELKNDLALIP